MNDNGSSDGYAAPVTGEDRQRWIDAIEAWLAVQSVDNPVVIAVDEDRSDGQQRWIVRVRGEDKQFFAIWFHLRQRTLAVETYFMPAPEEKAGQLFEHLLRRNLKLHRFRFAIGVEDAVYLVAELPLTEVPDPGDRGVVDDELDWLFGAAYTYVEQFFLTAMRIGFASRFGR